MFEHSHYVPREAHVCMPWRNGAGTTREIVRAPARGDSFAWRLSLASLQAGAPFSPYPGYARCVALVDGRGFRLHVAGEQAQHLCVRGEYALFAGSAEARCELLDGPCTDLSLMVREPGTIDRVTRLDISAEQHTRDAVGGLQVLFVLSGAIKWRAAGPPFAATPDGDAIQLNTHDALWSEGHGQAWSVSAAMGSVAQLLALSFTAP